MSNENKLDYAALGAELEKAGIVTKSVMEKSMQEMLGNFKGIAKSGMSPEEVMMHFEKGGCDDENCLLTKSMKEMYQNAFTRGTYYGVKLGAFGAKRGVQIE